MYQTESDKACLQHDMDNGDFNERSTQKNNF